MWTAQQPRSVGGDHLATHVDVLRDGRVGVAELVGDLAGAEAGLVQPGRDGLSERVRGDPSERTRVAADLLPAERPDAAPLTDGAADAVERSTKRGRGVRRIAQVAEGRQEDDWRCTTEAR